MTFNEFSQLPLNTDLVCRVTGIKFKKEGQKTIRNLNVSKEFTSLFSIEYDNKEFLPVVDLSRIELY